MTTEDMFQFGRCTPFLFIHMHAKGDDDRVRIFSRKSEAEDRIRSWNTFKINVLYES